MTFARNLSILAEGVNASGILQLTHGGTGQSVTGDTITWPINLTIPVGYTLTADDAVFNTITWTSGSGILDNIVAATGNIGDLEVGNLNVVTSFLTDKTASFEASANRRVIILPVDTPEQTGLPQTLNIERIGSDTTSGVDDSLWVFRSYWQTTSTTPGAASRFNARLVTVSPAGADPGETYTLHTRINSQASTLSTVHGAINPYVIRSGLPSSGVGVTLRGISIGADDLTGVSTATAGMMRPLVISFRANGADDIAGVGREAIQITIGKYTGGGAAPEYASMIGFYGETGVTVRRVIRPNDLTWTEAFVDGRGGTQGGSANTIWLKAGQTIAFDTLGTAGAANTKMSSNGTTIAFTGAGSFSGALSAASATFPTLAATTLTATSATFTNLTATTFSFGAVVTDTATFVTLNTTTLNASGVSNLATLNVSGNVAVATNKFTVAAATGNTVVAGTLGITGATTLAAFTSSGRGQAKSFVVEAGAYSMAGAYSYDNAPFGVRMSIPRVDGASKPIGVRDITRWSIQNDNSITWNTNNGRPAALRAQSLIWNVGTTGIDPALSWDGARVGNIISIVDNAPPVSYTRAPQSPAAQPSLTGYWITTNNRYPRGGLAPVLGSAQGSVYHYYSSIIMGGKTTTLPGARNYNHIRHVELGLFLRPGASARLFTGIGLPVASLTGLIPPEGFWAFYTARGGVTSPGFRTAYGVGGNAFAGADPLTGVGYEWVPSGVESRPTGRIGMDLLGVEFRQSSIRWTGGRIAGGALDDDDVGALETGPARLAGTADGADLSATGHIGLPTRTFFDDGGDLVSGELGMAPQAGALFYDDLGGTYLGRSRSATGFLRLECLTPPIYFGSSPPATLSLRMRAESGGDMGYLVTEAATTTSHPTMLTHDAVDAVVGMQLEYLSGPAAGEARDITAYDPATRIVTTDAFSTVPTATIEVIDNGTLNADPVSPSEDTIQNSWQWSRNGGTGTVVWAVGPPSLVTLTGDGTNPATFDQTATITPDILYTVRVTHEEAITLLVGTTQGDNDLGEFYLPYGTGDDDDLTGTIISSAVFLSGAGTTVWLRLQNVTDTPVMLDRIQMSASDALPVGGIRARVIPQFLVINQTWTPRNLLTLQKDGGAVEFGGTVEIGGAATGLSTHTATAFIPSGSTVPANGLYLPAANTLGWAANTTAKLQMDTVALFAAADDGLALGKSGTGFSDVFLASGAVINFNAGDVTLTHSADTLTVAGGTLATEALTATTVVASSTATATAFIPNSATVPINGMFLAGGGILGWSASSTARMQMSTTVLSPSTASAMALGSNSLPWGNVVSTGVATFNASGTAITSIAGGMLYLHAADAANTGLVFEAKAAFPRFTFRRANGTSTVPTALVTGDSIGSLEFRGFGTALTTGRATIQATAANDWDGSSQGANLIFQTTAIGAATTPTTRMTLTDVGHLVLATGTIAPYSTNVQAAAGTTISDAAQLTRAFTRLNTVAAGTGVILPTGVNPGAVYMIYNNGANPVKVYVGASQTIDGVAGATGVTLTNGNRCLFWYSATDTWHSMMFSGASA